MYAPWIPLQAIRMLYSKACHLPPMDATSDGGRHDRHHCRCFSVGAHTVGPLREKLVGLGFEPQMLEMPHGQVWGMRLRTSEHEQIHIKAMPDGMIESEAEPPPEYPLAHLNPKHSHSPHRDILGILRSLRIPFQRVRDVPATCRRPVVILPDNPVGWEEIAVAAGACIGIGIAVACARKS